MSPQVPVSAEPAVGFVLAGGQSSRMGSDKALLQLAGQPLVAHALSILRDAGLEARIAGARSDLASFAPVLADSQPGLGPLGGICTALASTSAELAVFVSVDLPLLPAALIACLLRHARISGRPVTLASVNGFTQTFPAVLERRSLPVLQNELYSGRLGCYSAFAAASHQLGQPISELPVEYLVQAGQLSDPMGLPAAFWFRNLNTSRDVERAAQHLIPARVG